MKSEVTFNFRPHTVHTSTSQIFTEYINVSLLQQTKAAKKKDKMDCSLKLFPLINKVVLSAT